MHPDPDFVQERSEQDRNGRTREFVRGAAWVWMAIGQPRNETVNAKDIHGKEFGFWLYLGP